MCLLHHASSQVLGVVLVELFDHLVIVFSHVLDVITNAVHGLLNVVVCLEDAVLELEAATVTVGHQGLLKLVENLRALSLLAEQDLF